MELSIILGLCLLYWFAMRAKNKRIKDLNKDVSNLKDGINTMSIIIRESNINNVPPKDLP